MIVSLWLSDFHDPIILDPIEVKIDVYDEDCIRITFIAPCTHGKSTNRHSIEIDG